MGGLYHSYTSSGIDKVSAPGLDDLMLWAVLAKDRSMAHAIWTSMVDHGDPIRMALLAGAAASAASKQDNLNSNEYERHSKMYTQWACDVLDCCKDRDEAQFVLRRPSQHGWPYSILRLANATNSKSFVAHAHVQVPALDGS